MHEVKLQPGVVSGLIYGTKARCYKKSHDPTGGSLDDDHKRDWLLWGHYLG